ncbi:DNA primase [Granulicella cerasi]|uniref:DNA primase n=1 Tax=Granulicella cerasi TaxID=741063 RepID=A0ABW1Z8L3_9BACT|nr:DNA primase [Granulicella cerasi]
MADNFAQTVKAQVDITRIVGEYLKLRKSGANWSALCPFHKEKSGSFYLYPQTSSYYCFGCHEHGDVFTFVMKMDNISFPEAVRAVAQKMGIPLPQRQFNSPEEQREAGLRKQLIDAHEAATQYFQQNLQSPEAARAREYMTSRGITPETVQRFRIGYAPDNFNDMRERLSKFFTDEVLRASGLFSWKEQEDGSAGQMYARFRKRITFPIANEQGKVIAFTARALDTDDKSGPKYMNSPETPLYTKGNVLFNLDKAKAAIKEQDAAVLVEGQMDAISLFMAGVQNVIATSGTAFTEAQVRMLGRFTKRVWLNFDPDNAGMNAAEKTLAMMVEEGFETKVVTLDGGLDPDRFVRERGVQAYAQAVREAARYADFLVARAQQLYPVKTPEGKIKAMNFLLPHIKRIPNAITRVDFANNAAQKLGIENSLMQQEIRQAAQQRLESVRAPQAKLTSLERVLLSALILPDADSARQLASTSLAAHPEWYAQLATAGLIEVLVSGPAPDNALEVAPDQASRVLLATAMQQGIMEAEDGNLSLHALVERALQALHIKQLERRERELRMQIGEAGRRGDNAMTMQLMQEKQHNMQELLRLERELSRTP